MFANCIPLVLKFFNQNILSYVTAKNRSDYKECGISNYRIYSPISMWHLESEVLYEANFGEFIGHAYKSVPNIAKPYCGSFVFLPQLRHIFVVNISRISKSLRNFQKKIDCIEVK